MLDNIAAKIEEHVNTILKKKVITSDDCRVLTDEWLRLYILEEKAKLEKQSIELAEQMQQVMSSMGMPSISE